MSPLCPQKKSAASSYAVKSFNFALILNFAPKNFKRFMHWLIDQSKTSRLVYQKVKFGSKMQFLHQIPPKWYFRPSTSFYPDRSDIEPNEPWRAHIPMGLYQIPVSNRESIFFTCPTIGRLGRLSEKLCLNYKFMEHLGTSYSRYSMAMR